MARTSWLRVPYLRWPVRATLAAVAGPSLVTLLAGLPGQIPTEIAVLVYVPAVVGAAAIGGPIAGLGASLLSFLAVNYYFSAPLYSIEVDQTSDLVALTVFGVVAIAIGTLLASTLASRARIEQRERETRLLNQLATRLLSGDPIDTVLRRFAQSIVEMFRLARCSITTEVTDETIIVESEDVTPGEGARPFVAPMIVKGRQVGRIEVVADGERLGLERDEQEVMRAFAGQMALALEGIRLSDEVRGARLEAEASRLRAIMFSSVTHDLRTPLASITASVTSLLEGDPAFTPEARHEHLDTIRHEAQRLNRLVANLLDLSRIRAGVLIPKKVPAALDEVVENVVARMRTMWGDRAVQVVIVPEMLPDVPMDVVQIDQVVTNLVENAAKFSPPSTSITITLAATDGAVRVAIADEGPGIPPAERDRLFEPFQRGDTAPGPGTGLGLAIAKAIVEAHGGRIWLADDVDKGVTVVFELPIS